MASVHVAGSQPLEKSAHQCHICQMSYSYKYQLTNHMSTIHEEKNPFSCTICDKGFAALNNLKYHMAAFHEGGVDKPFKCHLCDKAFPSKPKLKRHIAVVHEGIKPYQCITCNVAFSEKSRLRGHLEGKDKYKCKNGVGNFVENDKMGSKNSEFMPLESKNSDYMPLDLPIERLIAEPNMELSETHPIQSQNSPPPENVISNIENNENICPICDSGFSTKYELNRHAVSVHEVENLQEFEDFQQKRLQLTSVTMRNILEKEGLPTT